MCSDKNLEKILDGPETRSFLVIFPVFLKFVFVSMTGNIQINDVVRSIENIRFC